MKTIAQTALLGLLLIPVANAQTVTVMGSTALGPLMKQAAEDYMKSHPGVQIAISGGGSMTGLNQVTAGGCTIGISDIFATEEQQKQGIRNFNIVVEPFTMIANPGVGVKNLNAQQAENVFTGAVTNWNQVGGKNMKIVRVNRPASSGTRAVQKATVLHGKEFSVDQVIQDSSGAVANMVATTPGAVSFIEMDFLSKNQGRLAGIAYNGAVCDKHGVSSGKYPLFSYGHAYVNPGKTDGKTLQVAEDFLKYVMSSRFQDTTVLKLGYMPVSYTKNLKTKL
nr:substrate-binding domain-containing protein [uncultured Holophaga sp.]